MDIQGVLQGVLEQIVIGNKVILLIAFGVMLISGVLWCFVSHRYFREIAIATGVLFGLIAGGVAGHYIGASLSGSDEVVSSFAFGLPQLIGAVTGALLGSILAIPLFYILVYLLGFGIGAAAVFLALSALRISMEEPLMVMLLGGFVVGSFLVWLSTRAQGYFTILFGALQLASAAFVLWMVTNGFGSGVDAKGLTNALRLIIPIVFLLSLVGGSVAYAMAKKKRPKQLVPPLKVPPAIPSRSTHEKDSF